jgi:hypothetical protein
VHPISSFHRYPIIGTVGLAQLKSGRTSAPRLPQAERWQKKVPARDRADNENNGAERQGYAHGHGQSSTSIAPP